MSDARDFHALVANLPLAKTALVVIDIQNDFAHVNGKASRWGADMRPVHDAVTQINHLVDAAREAGVLIAYARIEHAPETDAPNYRARYAARNMNPADLLCATGSWGAEFYTDLRMPRSEDVIVTKYGYDAFQGTRLDSVLRERGIEHLVITGLVTNLCVQTTAEHGFGLGYYVTVVHDATAGDDDLAHQAALRNLGLYFGFIVSTDDVIGLWQNASVIKPRKETL